MFRVVKLIHTKFGSYKHYWHSLGHNATAQEFTESQEIDSLDWYWRITHKLTKEIENKCYLGFDEKPSWRYFHFIAGFVDRREGQQKNIFTSVTQRHQPVIILLSCIHQLREVHVKGVWLKKNLIQVAYA